MARSRRSATRSAGPLSPPKQRQVASAQTTENRGSTTRKQQSTEAPSKLKSSTRLPIVEEEIDSTNANEQPLESDVDDDLDSISLNGSDSTDDNEVWVQDLDHELVIEGLASLYHDALKLITMVDPSAGPKIIDELKSEKSSVGRRYRQVRAHLTVGLQPYRPDDGFLPNEAILRKLAESCGPLTHGTGPDAILYLTNLAILVDEVVVRTEQSKLHFLANSFPGENIFGIFGDSGQTIRGQTITPLTETTIELALSLRTQFFLSEASKHQHSASFDPGDLLRQAFFDDDGQVLGFENQDEDTIEEISSAYNNRIKQIQSYFTKNSKAPINLKKLGAIFPPQSVTSDLVSWITQRKVELKQQIEAVGGPATIVDLLQEQSLQHAKSSDTIVVENVAAPAPSIPSARDRNPSTRMSNKVQQLKRIKAQREAQIEEEDNLPQDRHVRTQRQEISQSPLLGGSNSEGSGLLLGDEDEIQPKPREQEVFLPPPTQGSVVPSQKTAMILQVARRQAAQSNKENVSVQSMNRRFLDKQRGAKRVDWGDDFQDVAEKRRHEEVGIDDEDDDFEVDKRQQKRPRMSKATPPVSRQAAREDLDDEAWFMGGFDEDQDQDRPFAGRSAATRHVQESVPPASAQPGPSRSPLQIRTQKPSRPLPSSAPLRGEDQTTSPVRSQSLPRASQAQRANLQAKAMVSATQAATAARIGPKMQHRRAWTYQETERLMEMIALFGTSYATILKEDIDHPDGPELQSRGQVALKDKARNLKVDFLKAAQPLPDGFEYVKIKASDVEKLKEMGMRHHGAPEAYRAGPEDSDS